MESNSTLHFWSALLHSQSTPPRARIAPASHKNTFHKCCDHASALKRCYLVKVKISGTAETGILEFSYTFVNSSRCLDSSSLTTESNIWWARATRTQDTVYAACAFRVFPHLTVVLPVSVPSGVPNAGAPTITITVLFSCKPFKALQSKQTEQHACRRARNIRNQTSDASIIETDYHRSIVLTSFREEKHQ